MTPEQVVYRDLVWRIYRMGRWFWHTVITTLLHALLRADRVKAVGWLIRKTGYPINHAFNTLAFGMAGRRWEDAQLIHMAALHGAFDTLRWLLEQGANPNVFTRDGYCPIIIAALRGRVDLMALLVSKGADPNSKQPDGGTTLELWDFDRPNAAETLRLYHDRDFRGDEHAQRMAQHLDAKLAPAGTVTVGKRPRL